jgi:cytochrome c553
MKYIICGISILMLASCTTQESALNPSSENSTVAEKVEVCVACHGPNGKNGKAGVPPLGGRSYEELVAAMQRVKEAYSPQPLLGHSLSDQDIHDIATYFSNVK